MSERGAPEFPARTFPEACDQKLLGIYAQRDASFVLQRVRVPGGRISTEQLVALTDVAKRVGARPALHLTTRQDIEIHDLRPEAVPEVHRAMADVGLTAVGAAGDTVRNSTVDPLGGMARGNVDLLPLATAVDEAVRTLDGIWSLPRKFKMSFSGDERASMRPYFSDIGVIARADGSHDVVVGGSLGARPAGGVRFAHRVSAAAAAALAVAAVRMHAEFGDRDNRNRARLRHVREAMGEEAFRDTLERLWEEELRARRVVIPPMDGVPEGGSPLDHLRLGVPHGDLPIGVAEELARMLLGSGGQLRIGIEHDLHLFGVEASEIPPAAAAWLAAGRVVACPGRPRCSKAAGSTREAADALGAIAEQHPDMLFAISGCPNSCSHASAADVGVISRMSTVDGVRRPVYRVYGGGHAGADERLGEVVATDVSEEDLLAAVGAHIASTVKAAGPAPPGGSRE